MTIWRTGRVVCRLQLGWETITPIHHWLEEVFLNQPATNNTHSMYVYSICGFNHFYFTLTSYNLLPLYDYSIFCWFIFITIDFFVSKQGHSVVREIHTQGVKSLFLSVILTFYALLMFYNVLNPHSESFTHSLWHVENGGLKYLKI